jgi:hypothetical protein
VEHGLLGEAEGVVAVAVELASLNCAMDFFARVTSGFWPVMAVRSRTAPSMSFESFAASPTPMFTTTLTTRGISMTLP